MKIVYGPTTDTRLVTTTDRVARLERRPTVYDIVEEIKIVADDEDVLTGDGIFKWEISNDLIGLDIIEVKIFLTTTGGPCTCRIWNDSQQWNVLYNPLTIAAGSYSACTVIGDINETRNHLQCKNASGQWVSTPVYPPLENTRLWLNVDSAGGKGLGLIVTYGRDWRP